jgi:hypothetical protein
VFKEEPEKQGCLDDISGKKITFDTPTKDIQRCFASSAVLRIG